MENNLINSPLFRQQAYINGQWVDADKHQHLMLSILLMLM